MPERKSDTRRKILAGAWALREARRDQAFRLQLKTGLASFLVQADLPLFLGLFADDQECAE